MRISNNPARWTVLLLLGLITYQDYAQAAVAVSTQGENQLTASKKVQRQHLVTDVGHYHSDQAMLQEFEKASDVDDTTHLQQASKGMSQGNARSSQGPPKPSEKQNEPQNKQQIELSLEVDGPIEAKDVNSTKSMEKSDKDHI